MPIGFPGPLFSAGAKIPLPTGYSPGPWLWVSNTSIQSVGSTVTGWLDLSGNSNNLTINGTPTLGSINGIAAMLTSPNATKQYGTSTNLYPITSNCTWFCVINPQGSFTSYGRGLATVYTVGPSMSLNSSGSAWKLIVNDSSSPYGTCEGGVPTSGTPVLLTGIFQSSGVTGTATLQVNGSTVSTNIFNTPTVSNERVCVGIDPGQFGSPQSAYYGDQCIFTGVAWSGSNLLNLNRYFGNKFGIIVP